MELNKIYLGDAVSCLRELPDSCVHCVVTSPPYYGLRDYDVPGQFGMEESPEAYIKNLVELFREVCRVLRDDGTVWLNLGDCYVGSGMGGANYPLSASDKQKSNRGSTTAKGRTRISSSLKRKNLVGIPWRVALALQADGWILRTDIIWHKPNPMPESVKDRPTRAHEYIFLLTKREKYYYDASAIKEKSVCCDKATGGRVYKDARSFEGKHSDKQRGHGRRHAGFNERWDQLSKAEQAANGRNKRDVWTVATKPFPGAHFATYPEQLITPCILAGCPEGGIVLDPFLGSGTTALVARKNNRNFIGIELNPEYRCLALDRIRPFLTQKNLKEVLN